MKYIFKKKFNTSFFVVNSYELCQGVYVVKLANIYSMMILLKCEYTSMLLATNVTQQKLGFQPPRLRID